MLRGWPFSFEEESNIDRKRNLEPAGNVESDEWIHHHSAKVIMNAPALEQLGLPQKRGTSAGSSA
jgi:hypothetical protein